MYKVYGTFIFVPDLDLGTSGLEPNTAVNLPQTTNYWKLQKIHFFICKISGHNLFEICVCMPLYGGGIESSR